MKFNVAHIVLSLEVGGLEVLVAEMAKNMVREGHACTIYCLDNLGSLAQDVRDAGVEVILINRSGGFADLGAIRRLRKSFRAKKHSIIHTHNVEPVFYGAFAKVGLRNIRIIHTQHGLPTPFAFLNRLKARISGYLVDRFIGVSENSTRYAIESGWISKKKSQTILNGINTNRFRPDNAKRTQIRKELGLSDSTAVAICVARLSPIKNHARLVQLVKDLLDKSPETDFVLLLVGNGECRPAIEAKIEQLGLSDTVRLLGEVLETDKYLAAADLFLLASDSEGISVSILEAMSTGLPVVVTDVGGNREIVNDGETGYLVPLNKLSTYPSRVGNLISNRSLRDALSLRARERVTRDFSMDVMIANYQKVYTELLNA